MQNNTEDQLTLFVGDSLVSPTASQENEKPAKMIAICGLQPLTLFAQVMPDGLLVKTSKGFSQANLDGSLEKYSQTWPQSGTLSNGLIYRGGLSALPICETESGWLPTPTKHNSKEGAYPAEYTRNTPTLATHAGGKINPEWSEHLMGFPIKWTELEH